VLYNIHKIFCIDKRIKGFAKVWEICYIVTDYFVPHDMSFIRKKRSKSGKIYAYEITATWDSTKKQSRSTGKYLGVVDDNGAIIPKNSKPRIKKEGPLQNERLIQDFGNGFLVAEFIKKSAIYEPLCELSGFIQSLYFDGLQAVQSWPYV